MLIGVSPEARGPDAIVSPPGPRLRRAQPARSSASVAVGRRGRDPGRGGGAMAGDGEEAGPRCAGPGYASPLVQAPLSALDSLRHPRRSRAHCWRPAPRRGRARAGARAQALCLRLAIGWLVVVRREVNTGWGGRRRCGVRGKGWCTCRASCQTSLGRTTWPPWTCSPAAPRTPRSPSRLPWISPIQPPSILDRSGR